MLKFIDLSFHAAGKGVTLLQCIERYKPSYGYLAFLKEKMDVEVIMHFDEEQEGKAYGVSYKGFKGRNGFFHVPFKTLNYIRKQKPDVVLIHGLLYPVQVMFLKMFARRTTIVIQLHGNTPAKGALRRFFYKFSDKLCSGYICTSREVAEKWVEGKLISSADKFHEILGGSTLIKRNDNSKSINELNSIRPLNILWVARLDKNKDPLTVIEAFERYLRTGSRVRLNMIYQTEELLPEVQVKLNGSSILKERVTLIGKVDHSKLADWYSASDFFVTGSHYEATGFALLEAMACGCIPIVTDIPTFMKITVNGRYGLLFKPGNPDDLFEKLTGIEKIDREQFSEEITTHFKKELSFEKIAEDMYNLMVKMINKNDT